MRKIKFRVWCKNRKEWEKDICFIGLDGNIYQQRFGFQVMVPVDKNNHAIMQYTGLKDENGVDIYEGDIGWDEHYECFGVVEFDEGKFVYSWDNICDDLIEVRDAITICGNIYENQELLETKKD